jgi:preprotein translocase subunit SecA
MEEILGIDNIYTEAGFSEVHHIEQALRAKACYQADKDYIIKDDQVIIIDQFTGRLMPGRRYSHGLHQAIEAKENVEIKRESRTLATVTFQNYFRMFDKLGGMTGTAVTEAEEFYQIYGLDTITIPTNKPVIRNDKQDAIYKNQKGKYLAIVKIIKEINKTGQPVLVGTISVEKSEMISKLLSLEGFKHNVLNAKQHEREAEIVSEAGQKGAVTIATNMAGRGTDIKLGEGVTELGGLYVIGTERHESRRIDNQLRGRSGRQGDAGASQFFVSMEDELMRLFGGEKIMGMMNMLKLPEDMPVENNIITRSIESAQKKVEGRNFDIRKHVVEYDDVMNVHREVIYKRRKDFLMKEDLKLEITNMIEETAETSIQNYTDARPPKEWDFKQIYEVISAIHKDEKTFSLDEISVIKNQKELIEKAKKHLLEAYAEREKNLPEPDTMRRIEKAVYLRANDVLWMEHIDAMSRLRENVAFSGMAQKQPLTEYQSQGYEMFIEMINMIRNNTVNTLFKIDLARVAPREMLQKAEVKNIQTNENQIAAPLSGDRKSIISNNSVTRNTFDQPDNNNPVIIRSESYTSKETPTPRAGRNDPCPCGSGKKYKKCHGAV